MRMNNLPKDTAESASAGSPTRNRMIALRHRATQYPFGPSYNSKSSPLIYGSVLFASMDRVFQKKNSAVADKPRDAFVQMQWRGRPPKNTPLSICATMPNFVVLR